jgi:hypothetical protein
VTREMTDRERREIREVEEMVREVREVCDSDAARQAVGVALAAMEQFAEKGEVFEAEDYEGDGDE